MQEHELWLFIATRDFGASTILLKEKFTHQASYFAQQAAEKALKGYLISQHKIAKRTHDLEVLLNACIELNASFKRLETSAYFLSPYATDSRYPGTFSQLREYESAELLKHAKKILLFVLDIHPVTNSNTTY